MTPFNLIQSLRSWFFARDGDIVLQDGRAIKISNADITITTGGIVITGGTVTIGGAAVSVAGHVHTHASTTGRTANDHHNESHTVASHSDTTGTGSELNTLTDGSDASSLHVHDGRYFQESEFGSTVTGASPLKTDSNGGLAIERLGVNASIPSSDGIIETDQIVLNDTGVSVDATGSVRIKTSGVLILAERSAPASPASGYGYVYFDTAKRITTKNDAGTVANFYPTSAFTNDPGASSAPLFTNSNGYLRVQGFGVGGGSMASGQIIAGGGVKANSGLVSGGEAASTVGAVTIGERSSAAGTVSGYGQLYCKTDGKLYFRNDAGTETALT